MPTERIPMKCNQGMMLDAVPYEVPEGYAQNISGAIVSTEGLKSVYLSTPAPISGVTTQIIRGIITVRASNGELYWIFGTSDGKLWRCPAKIGSLTATDISKAATTYSDAEWSFTQYGDWVVGVNGVNNPQVLKGIASGTFTDLGGSPPKAKYCHLDNGHLILANYGAAVTVTNGTFTASATAAWTIGAGWEYSANAMYKNSAGAGELLQTISPDAGATYKVSFDITGVTAGAAWTDSTTNSQTYHTVVAGISGTYQTVLSYLYNQVTLKGTFVKSSNSGSSWVTSTYSLTAADRRYFSGELCASSDMTVMYSCVNLSAGGVSTIIFSVDQGSSWATATASGLVTGIVDELNCNDTGSTVAVVVDSKIMVSTDGAGSFTKVYSLSAGSSISYITRVAINGNTIVAGYESASVLQPLLISADSGSAWTVTTDKFKMKAIDMDHSASAIWVASNGNYLQKSTDGGATWVQKGLSKSYWTDVVVSGDGRVVAGRYFISELGAPTYRYTWGSAVSLDGGESWSDEGTITYENSNTPTEHHGFATPSGNMVLQGTNSGLKKYAIAVPSQLTVELGSTDSDLLTLENQAYELNITAVDTDHLKFKPSTGSRFVLDNVAVQEVALGNRTVKWSAYESIEDWTPSVTTGAGSQILYEGDGEIVGLSSLGTRWIVLMERSLQVGQYIGGTYTFTFQKPIRGFTVAKSDSGYYSSGIRWADVSGLLYFAGINDFFVTDGMTVNSLTSGNRQSMFSNYRTLQTSVIADAKNNVILFSKYDPSAGHPISGTHTHRIFAYNYALKSWTHFYFITDASAASGSFPRLVNIESDEAVDRMLITTLYKNASSTINSSYWEDLLSGEVIIKTRELGNGIDYLTCNRVKPIYHLRESSDYPSVIINYRMDEADAESTTTLGAISTRSYYDNIVTGCYIGATIKWKGPASFEPKSNISGCIFMVAKTGER